MTASQVQQTSPSQAPPQEPKSLLFGLCFVSALMVLEAIDRYLVRSGQHGVSGAMGDAMGGNGHGRHIRDPHSWANLVLPLAPPGSVYQSEPHRSVPPDSAVK